MAEVLFASLSSPKLKISVNGGRVIFESGVARLDDSDEQQKKWIEELRNAIKNKPAISQLVREINRELGEEVVRKHQEQVKSLANAVGGSVSSAHLSQAKLNTELAHLANNPDPEAAKTLAAAIAAGEIVTTEKASDEVVRKNDEGMKPVGGLAGLAKK